MSQKSRANLFKTDRRQFWERIVDHYSNVPQKFMYKVLRQQYLSKSLWPGEQDKVEKGLLVISLHSW